MKALILTLWRSPICKRTPSQVECGRRSSLYSMSIRWHVPADKAGAQLRVAAGSAFLHILVWQLPAVSFASLRQAASQTTGAFVRRVDLNQNPSLS